MVMARSEVNDVSEVNGSEILNPPLNTHFSFTYCLFIMSSITFTF